MRAYEHSIRKRENHMLLMTLSTLFGAGLESIYLDEVFAVLSLLIVKETYKLTPTYICDMFG